MAKSKRSKVKLAHRAMRRAVMQPKFDAQLRKQATKVYSAIGLPMPTDQSANAAPMRARSHGGSELVSTFTPTPKAPTLNAVHGPLANRRGMQVEGEVVGFPIVGAGQRARTMSVPSKTRASSQRMDVDGHDVADDEYDRANAPYFYNRKYKFERNIRKRRRQPKLLSSHVQKGITMDIDASA